MKITPNQVFLDGYDRYEPGREYDVPDELALRAKTAGWVDAPAATVAGTVDVEAHDATQGQVAELGPGGNA